MTYKVIKLNDTDAVVISDEDPSNKDWYWNENTGKVKHYFENRECYPSLIHRYKVIATISPYQIEGLPMLELLNNEEECLEAFRKLHPLWKDEAILHSASFRKFKNDMLPNQEEDIEKLAKQQWGNVHRAGVLGFIEGYKAAQKQYSEDDMKNMFILGGKYKVQQPDMFLEKMKEILQSLQKKQFPIAVELTEDLKVIKWLYK